MQNYIRDLDQGQVTDNARIALEKEIAEENIKASKSEFDSKAGFLIGNPWLFVGLKPPAESEGLCQKHK